MIDIISLIFVITICAMFVVGWTGYIVYRIIKLLKNK